MGGKESKPLSLSYEEAIKRVSEGELSRIKDAYKRTATSDGSLSKQAFFREVLGDVVSPQLAELIFVASGGTAKGISFKDLFCSLVLLTRGKKEEKIKFIFGVYSNEGGTHVVRTDMLKQLQSSEAVFSYNSIHKLFKQNDKVNYEDFQTWLLRHPDATTVTCWLLDENSPVSLSNDLETPTFYQTLAGVTHLEESEILELEKQYWALKGSSPSGKLDSETLVPMMSPPLPALLARGVFNAFDENRDNHIDFKEMACGISAACRGPTTERQRFCFKIFDRDCDGRLNAEELRFMVEALLALKKQDAAREQGLQNGPSKTLDDVVLGLAESEVKEIVNDLLMNHDTSNSKSISQEEFLIWTLKSDLTSTFTEIIFQICHVLLGLKPSQQQEQGEIVLGWLRRAEKNQLVVGQFWYLITIDWWNSWLDYVALPVGEDCLSLAASSLSSSPSASLNGTLKKTLPIFQKTNLEDSIAMDNSGVKITSIANLENEGTVNSSSLPRRNPSTASLCVAPAESRGSSPCPSPYTSRRGTMSNSSLNGRPSAIDNNFLLEAPSKVSQLTSEGGRLKKTVPLVQGRDFVLVPDALWKTLQQWYGGGPALPRQIIHGRAGGELELELYLVTLRIYTHAQNHNRTYSNGNNPGWAGVVGNYGVAAFSAQQYYVPNLGSLGSSTPKRTLAYQASFSRLATIKKVYEFLSGRLRLRMDDIRLWHLKEENSGMTLLEDDDMTLECSGLMDLSSVLLEIRNKDLTWPEEMSQISRNASSYSVKSKIGPGEKGLTGLNNLGNTCFLNAALQCCSNTVPLTTYFLRNMHLYEINTTNPNGMKGLIARHYGALLHEIWGGSARTVAPLKLRWTIGQYSDSFASFQQHDIQELLAFLLDGLHEDLNRVYNKPYNELKDSEGRPDVLVAQEAWENHICRNKSIIVDLFHGQLKSKVTCSVCGNESARFDPFSYLTLQLPMENYIYIEAVVVKLTGETPVRYGLRLSSESKLGDIKWHLHALSGVKPSQLLLTELVNSQLRCVHSDAARVRQPMGNIFYAYELPSSEPMGKAAGKPSHTAAKDRHLFTHIQRTTHQSSPCIKAETGNAKNSGSDDLSLASEPDYCSYQSPVTNGDIRHGETRSLVETRSQSAKPASHSTCDVTNIQNFDNPNKGFLLAFHRKMTRQEVYFLSSQKTRASLFGLPLIIPCKSDTPHQDLYQSVWMQVARLVSPLPPSESPASNHAQDCDDSLGYEFPFVLRLVDREGMHCAVCPWHRFCRGCEVPCDDQTFALDAAYLAIDWDPTALHLRYQSSLEKSFIIDASVPEMQRRHTEPISLYDCLEAFCSEETLDYSCEKCKKPQKAEKKMQIWRLPPIMIVHLKRFQNVNNKWVKSQKIVEFPIRGFNPTEYLASVPRQTILLHQAELEGVDPATYVASLHEKDNVFLEILPENKVAETVVGSPRSTLQVPNGVLPHRCTHDPCNVPPCTGYKPCPTAREQGLVRASPQTPSGQEDIMDKRRRVRNGSVLFGDALQDFHQHKLKETADPLDLKYNLYAIACHTGIMEGGHYVCYAKNAAGRWICFNDSSCREVPESQVDLQSAYLLFYEREGLHHERYMPNVDGKSQVPPSEEQDEDKRQCSTM